AHGGYSEILPSRNRRRLLRRPPRVRPHRRPRPPRGRRSRPRNCPPSHRRRPSPVAKCPPRQIISFAHLASASAAGHATILLSLSRSGEIIASRNSSAALSRLNKLSIASKKKTTRCESITFSIGQCFCSQTANTSVAPV